MEGRKREKRQGKERGRCGGREERSTKKGRENGEKRGSHCVSKIALTTVMTITYINHTSSPTHADTLVHAYTHTHRYSCTEQACCLTHLLHPLKVWSKIWCALYVLGGWQEQVIEITVQQQLQ